jgi:hypothetical protein
MSKLPWRPIADAPVDEIVEVYQPEAPNPPGAPIPSMIVLAKCTIEEGGRVWRAERANVVLPSPTHFMLRGDKEAALGPDHPDVRRVNEAIEEYV